MSHCGAESDIAVSSLVATGISLQRFNSHYRGGKFTLFLC